MFFLSLFLSCSGENKENDTNDPNTYIPADTGEVVDTGEDTATTEEDCPVSMNLLSGETLEPSVIRLFFTLRDCNDYGITGKTAEDFVISEDGSEISVFESSQQLIPSSLGYDIKTLLLLDMSGSIVSSGNLPNLQESASNFVTSVAGTQSVGIYGFDGAQEIYELVPFTDDSQVLLDGIAELTNYEIQDNSTNLNGGVIKALERLQQEELLSTSSYFQGTLIVFTDGTDQAGWNTDAQAKNTVSGTSHGVFSIGLGGEVDTGHLSDLGKSGSWTANDVSELNDAFTEMSDVIRAKAESLYIFAYCSPKRNGEHILSLRLIEEDLSLDFGFDATGFQGGCGEDHFADSDQDGFRPWDGDCDDENPSVYPGAAEVCDGLDNNCDEVVDEGLVDSIFYADADGDGYGDANSPLEACTAPAGYVPNTDDCDDGNSNSTHFSVDSDCDGILNVDETGPVFDTAATISPSSGVYTGTTIQCSAVVSDQEDGSITPTYAWSIGGVAVGTGTTYTVSSATSNVGDSITCTATAIDSDLEMQCSLKSRALKRRDLFSSI